MPRRKRPLPSKNNTRNIFRRPKSCAKPCEYFLKQLFWHSLCLLVANINTENAEVGVEGLKCMPKKQGAPTPMCRCMTSTLEQQEINTSCVPKFGMLISPNLRKNAYFKQIQRTLWNWHLGKKLHLYFTHLNSVLGSLLSWSSLCSFREETGLQRRKVNYAESGATHKARQVFQKPAASISLAV